jgi:hypothetical protein
MPEQVHLGRGYAHPFGIWKTPGLQARGLLHVRGVVRWLAAPPVEYLQADQSLKYAPITDNK